MADFFGFIAQGWHGRCKELRANRAQKIKTYQKKFPGRAEEEDRQMKKSMLRKNQKGFTLIEIIAVLVILGILAAVAIPKYIDMREDAVKKSVVGVSSELNARERLTLAQWKLQDKSGNYTAPDTIMGPDWNGGLAIASTTGFQYQGKTVTCTRTAQTDENVPATWACVVTAGT